MNCECNLTASKLGKRPKHIVEQQQYFRPYLFAQTTWSGLGKDHGLD